jgi:hypothetical protein
VVSKTLQLDAAGAFLFSYLLKAEPDGYSHGLCRTYAHYAPGPSHGLLTLQQSIAPYLRKPLQFIVIAVMSVMGGTFPDTNRVFYMTMNGWCVWGPPCHCHGHRHRENGLGKRLIRRRDDDDAHDDDLRTFSWGPH